MVSRWNRGIFVGVSILIGCFYGLVGHAVVPDSINGTNCPMVEVEVERLPDMNVPRSGHNMFYVNGEMVVVGGHTTGFIPTATAEYYRDGKWHLLQTVYAHDNGLGLVLKSGKILIAGGHERHLGIGQTFPVEMYDPATHAFDGFGCLDHKRAMASGLELDSGKVMVVGNWYGDDAIELFDGNKQFTHVKGVAIPRSLPFVFRTAVDNALVLGAFGTRGEQIKSDMVDQLRGEPLHIPLLEAWHPICDWKISNLDYFIGNEATGDFSYLFPVQNDDGQVAIALVRNREFSLLPTACPVPMKSPWGHIRYFATIVVDRNAKRGYLLGFGENDGEHSMKYVLSIDYDKEDAAQLTLYYTNKLPEYEFNVAIDAVGDMMVSGGSMHDNFKPSPAVYLLHLRNHDQGKETPSSFHGFLSYLPWGVAVVALLLLLAFGWHLRRKNRLGEEMEATADTAVDAMTQQTDSTTYAGLMESICQIMDERQLFLNSDLKVSDLAAELKTNSRYVSDCIKTIRNVTFKQFVNSYRVEYAKQLMRQHPEMKLSAVGLMSGFSNEMTFFRTFKSFTDMTPREWISQFEQT